MLRLSATKSLRLNVKTIVGTYAYMLSSRSSISKNFSSSILRAVLDRTSFVLQDSGNLQWVEFFAGEAQATRMHAFAGFQVAKLDIAYMSAADAAHANPMDLLTDAGFAFLDCKIIRCTLVF